MINPPKPFRIASADLTLFGDDHSGSILRVHFDSQGAGFYAVIDTSQSSINLLKKDEPAVAFDPDELDAFAKWVRTVCETLDKTEKK
jgi:hypothetical protein